MMPSVVSAITVSRTSIPRRCGVRSWRSSSHFRLSTSLGLRSSEDEKLTLDPRHIETRTVPAAQGGRAPVQHHLTQPLHAAVFLERFEELFGGNHAAFGVDPAGQRLGTADTPGRGAELRLIPGLDLAVLERPRRFAAQCLAGRTGDPDAVCPGADGRRSVGQRLGQRGAGGGKKVLPGGGIRQPRTAAETDRRRQIAVVPSIEAGSSSADCRRSEICSSASRSSRSAGPRRTMKRSSPMRTARSSLAQQRAQPRKHQVARRLRRRVPEAFLEHVHTVDLDQKAGRGKRCAARAVPARDPPSRRPAWARSGRASGAAVAPTDGGRSKPPTSRRAAAGQRDRREATARPRARRPPGRGPAERPAPADRRAIAQPEPEFHDAGQKGR